MNNINENTAPHFLKNVRLTTYTKNDNASSFPTLTMGCMGCKKA